MEAKPGDLFQIINEKHRLFGEFIICTEPKSWGIMGYLALTFNDYDESLVRVKDTDLAYIRINHEEIKLIGHLHFKSHPDRVGRRSWYYKKNAEINKEANESTSL